MELKSRLKRLEFYLKDCDSPILVDFLKPEQFNEPIVIDGSISNEELYGDMSFEPEWYTKLKNSNKEGINYLIIDNLAKVDMLEQKKFVHLLKDRKCNNIVLPKNAVIVVIINKDEKELIDKEVLSYLIQV
jgi:hypothetical protein